MEQAITLLVQNQAALAQQHTAFLDQMLENGRRYNELAAMTERRFAAIDQRFASIEAELETIKSILAGLPEAIRQKIGFKRR